MGPCALHGGRRPGLWAVSATGWSSRASPRSRFSIAPSGAVPARGAHRAWRRWRRHQPHRPRPAPTRSTRRPLGARPPPPRRSWCESSPRWARGADDATGARSAADTSTASLARGRPSRPMVGPDGLGPLRPAGASVMNGAGAPHFGAGPGPLGLIDGHRRIGPPRGGPFVREPPEPPLFDRFAGPDPYSAKCSRPRQRNTKPKAVID
jgi:hypothetical protein